MGGDLCGPTRRTLQGLAGPVQAVYPEELVVPWGMWRLHQVPCQVGSGQAQKEARPLAGQTTSPPHWGLQ